MKIRLTIMTENNVPRPLELTESETIAAWQAVMDAMCSLFDSNDRATIESAEFIEDGDGDA